MEESIGLVPLYAVLSPGVWTLQSRMGHPPRPLSCTPQPLETSKNSDQLALLLGLGLGPQPLGAAAGTLADGSRERQGQQPSASPGCVSFSPGSGPFSLSCLWLFFVFNQMFSTPCRSFLFAWSSGDGAGKGPCWPQLGRGQQTPWT